MAEDTPPPTDADAPPGFGGGANVIPIRAQQHRTRAFKHLPHSLGAEMSILGGVILRPEVIDQLTTLEVDDFYDPRNKAVFGAMRNIVHQAQPIDLTTLEVELERAEKLDAIGGVAYLGELALKVPTPDNVIYYTQIVQEAYAKRQVMLRSAEMVDAVGRGSLDAAEAAHELTGELQRIRDRALPPAEQTARWIQPLGDVFGTDEPDDDDSQDWIARDLVPRGEPSLFAGDAKAGKTWLALILAIDIALGHDVLAQSGPNTYGAPARVLVLALEDAKRRLWRRIWEVCRGLGITPNHPLIRENLRVSRSPLSLPDARDAAALTRELRAWKPALVIADNVTRVMVGDQNSTRDAAAFTKAWHTLCLDTESAMMFLHHTRKSPSAQQGDGKRGPLDPFEDIRGSGDLIAGARHILRLRAIDTEGLDTGEQCDAPPSPDQTSRRRVSELFAKGNLDLRIESRVLEFVRDVDEQGRPRARLLHHGDPAGFRAGLVAHRKAVRKAAKDAERDLEDRARWEMVRTLAEIDTPISPAGTLSSNALADRLGCSERTAANYLKAYAARGLLQRAGNHGYRVPTQGGS